jgi:HTH-type transcriptional regulator/antitoxin HigA
MRSLQSRSLRSPTTTDRGEIHVRRRKLGDTFRYEPNYAVSPGAVLAEMLDGLEMSHAEFARRCGRSSKLISEIIAGKAPVEPETALQFERVLGVEAAVWLNLEANYQLHGARQGDEEALRQQAEWSCNFPIKDLVKLGLIDKPSDPVDAAHELLAFFGVGSIKAWELRYREIAVSYRHSVSFKSSPAALAAWLRIGELWAQEQECAEYNKTAFLHALRHIEGLTRRRPEEFVPRMRKLCNGAGVAFVLVPRLAKTSVSGAARWLTPRKALIQQSDRHKTNDHFWFTFFHEAAHLILHSKRDVFVDETDGPQQGVEAEEEANHWAGDQLVPEEAIWQFKGRERISERSVKECAREFNVAPGVLVGRLQFERILPPSHLNALKHRIEIRQAADGSFGLVSRAA